MDRRNRIGIRHMSPLATSHTKRMDQDILFTERQKFKQWWLWLILLGTNGLMLFGVYRQVIGGQPFGDIPTSDTGLLIITGFTLLLTLLFMNFRLDTMIKADGIYVRFFPFHLQFRHYPWDKIKQTVVKPYRPITDYGGWGLRFGLFAKGKALNVSGNIGLQLEFTDGKRLLIGTNKPGELREALKEAG